MKSFCYVAGRVKYTGYRKEEEIHFLRTCKTTVLFYRYDGKDVYEHAGPHKKTYTLDELAAEDLHASILMRVACPDILNRFGLKACGPKPF